MSVSAKQRKALAGNMASKISSQRSIILIGIMAAAAQSQA